MDQSKDRARLHGDELARAVAAEIAKTDRASRFLGMDVVEVRRGFARVAMTVTPDMANGQDLCHGGLIFTLADSSFGFACNTRNQRALLRRHELGFVFQGFNLLQRRSALENVALPLICGGKEKSVWHPRAMELLKSRIHAESLSIVAYPARKTIWEVLFPPPGTNDNLELIAVAKLLPRLPFTSLLNGGMLSVTPWRLEVR